jgi:uncharacterized protein
LQGSTNSLKPFDALRLISSEGCDAHLISHVKAVSLLAKQIALKIKSKGADIDVAFVEVAALLHDIGRSRTHGISHGVEGAAIMRKLGFEAYARVCERHIGAGLSRTEAKELGLPEGDYLPETLEEKVVAYADKLIEGDKVVPIDNTISDLKEKLGSGHPAISRVKELTCYITSLTQ